MAVPSGKLNQDKGQEALPLSEFILACRRGDCGAVKLFLAEDPSLANIPDQNGKTPLMYAVEANSEELSRLLLEHKADVNAIIHSGPDRGITALWLAVADERNLRLAQILLEKGANDPDACPRAKYHQHQGKTVFWYAVYHAAQDDDWTLVYSLLKKGVTELDTCPVNEKDAHRGMTPLLLASVVTRGGNPEAWNFIRLLLEKEIKDLDASPASIDGDNDDEEEGTNALWWAANGWQWDVVRLLVEKGARGFGAAPIKGRLRGRPMLMLLVQENKWDLIRFLLKVDSRNLDVMSQSQENDPGSRGLTLSWYAAYDGEWDVLSDLLNRGVNYLDICPHEGDDQYETILWYTIKAGLDSVFRLLLTKGVSLELTGNPKINLNLLKAYLDYADKNEAGWSSLIMTFNAAKVLFDFAEDNEFSDSEKPCLKHYLTVLGPALNGRVNGKTALQIAMEIGNVPVAEALILAGADLPFAYDASEILLTEKFDKLRLTLHTELKKLLELHSKRRESKEEVEETELHESIKAEEKIKKIEEKIKRISELEKLARTFAKLQALRVALNELVSHIRETKEEAEDQELKESVEARTKKILELVSELLKRGQTLEHPLHKDTFYYQLGELLHEGIEQQKVGIPPAMVLEAFSQVSPENRELYPKACDQMVHYSLITQVENEDPKIGNLEATTGPISLDEDESGLDKKLSREERAAKEEVLRGVRVLNMSSPDPNLTYRMLMKAVCGENISEMEKEFGCLSKEESRHNAAAMAKVLYFLRGKFDKAFSKTKESRQSRDKQSGFSSSSSSSSSLSSSSSSSGASSSGEKITRPEIEKTGITSKNSRKRQRSEEIDRITEVGSVYPIELLSSFSSSSGKAFVYKMSYGSEKNFSQEQSLEVRRPGNKRREFSSSSSSSSSSLGKGMVLSKIELPKNSSKHHRSKGINQATEGQLERKTGQERREQVKSTQPSLQSVEERSQLLTIDKAFAALFSERNFGDVSYCFSKGEDVIKALRDEPGLQSCKVHIDALADLGRIEQEAFNWVLARNEPSNQPFVNQLKNFYKQQRELYQNSLKDKEVKQTSDVTSVPDPTQLVAVATSFLSQEPSVPSVDSSPNTSVETAEDQRKQGKKRWLDRLALAHSIPRQKQEGDTLKAAGESNSSSGSSVHFSFKRKRVPGEFNHYLRKKRQR